MIMLKAIQRRDIHLEKLNFSSLKLFKRYEMMIFSFFYVQYAFDHSSYIDGNYGLLQSATTSLLQVIQSEANLCW